MYGWLKRQFEDYLSRACQPAGIQAAALRLECPGVLSNVPWNFYISTSIENTVRAFDCALRSDLSCGFETFNVADGQVDQQIVDIQHFIRTNWKDVPNYTSGNECLLSTAKARALLGYEARSGGRYHALSVLW